MIANKDQEIEFILKSESVIMKRNKEWVGWIEEEKFGIQGQHLN